MIVTAIIALFVIVMVVAVVVCSDDFFIDFGITAILLFNH